MRIQTIFILAVTCLYAQSAVADGAQSFLGGLMQGVTQQRAANNAQRTAQEQTENTNNMLVSEYQQCMSSDPELARHNDFASKYTAVTPCLMSSEKDFISKHPNSPANWFMTMTGEMPDEKESKVMATTPEIEQMKLLKTIGEDCWGPISNYSGGHNVYIRKIVAALNAKDSATDILFDNYFSGKISRGEFMRKDIAIITKWKRQNTESVNGLNKDKASKLTQRKSICDGQVVSTRQAIQQEQLSDTLEQQQEQIRRQQQQIQQQQQEIDNANMAAADAETGELNAKAAAAMQAQQAAQTMHR